MRKEMKKQKKDFLRKSVAGVIAGILALSMTTGTMSPAAANVQAADLSGVTREITADDKVADSSTLNDWQNYFEEGTTEYAGGVWTDKSVFEDAESLKTAIGTEAAQELGISMDSENFMVAMSAIASNKEIVGYSTIPTDTIIILDLSQSMDNSRSIPDTISAANDAIGDLLALNKNNRVGVVLYSGNSELGTSGTNTGTLLLGLDRYTAGNGGNYLRYTGNSNATAVTIAQNLSYENGTRVTAGSKTTVGGTYIQNGLNIAMDEFLDADPVIGEDNVQSDETRMPIFVLMSDGAPTTANTDYAPEENEGMGTSNVGNGSSTTSATAATGFLTQLTAAYARAMVEEHYGTDAKFYTLGLNLSNQDSAGQYVAESVLNPVASMSAITEYWSTLFENNSVSFSAPGTSTGSDNPSRRVTVTLSETVKELLGDTTSQEYVDRYFEADNNAELSDAFTDIVNEIILQSAYYPTLVAADEKHDLGGYVTFEDEIGLFMEVKNITGIMLGDNQLFTGEALAEMMLTGDFGNRNEFTELGWELVETVAERIGVTQDVAIELLKNAWADGQLSYTNDDEFSNYIGWYEGSNGEYVAYWNDQHTEADIPAGAQYISKSYGFYGTVRPGGLEALESDMMHIVIKVRTEIATGHQDVVFQIPASLIPTLTYHVTLDADNFEDADEITLEQDGDRPIRLLFEVGIRDDINELNVEEVMAAVGHTHEGPDGEIYFYTNQWGSLGDDHDEVNYDLPFSHLVTTSHFHPSEENERYYYTKDTVIYTENGTPYTGNTAPSGGDYYRQYLVFEGNAQSAEMVTVSEKISAETIQLAQQAEDGTWYIPAGTIFKTINPEYYTLKTPDGEKGGPTETLNYSDYPAILHPEGEDDTYDVYDFLGNNGRVGLKPATGIKLTKLVDDTITEADAEYTFTIRLSDNVSGNYDTVKSDGTNVTEGTVTFANGVAAVTLKANETIYITGLPAGAYTITEAAGAGYKVKEVTVDGEAEAGITAEDAITANHLDSVVFTNTESKEGNLIVRKTVTHDLGEDPEALAEKVFKITVTLTDANGAPLANQTFQAVKSVTNEELDVTTDAAGKFTTDLKHNQSITILDIPEGAKYTVSESENPNGFYLDTTEENLIGTIAADHDSIVTVVNDYRPGGVPTEEAITVSVTKTIDGREWTEDDTFTFQLEKHNADGSWTVVGEPQTVTNATKDTPFTFEIGVGSLTTIGTHDFRVVELNANSIPGITSDAARYFSIVVTDTDMDGALEVAEIKGNVTFTDEQNLTMNFVNTYTTEGNATLHIPIEKLLSNETGVDISLAGFQFGLYDSADELISDSQVTTNAAGDAAIHMIYTSEQFGELDTDGDNVVTLEYTLKEIAGSVAGMEYTNAEYKITVTLTSEDGQLSSSMTMTGADNTAVDVAKFTNEFKLQETDLDLGIHAAKSLEGRELGAGEFIFHVYETGADFAVPSGAAAVTSGTNAEDGSISFGEIKFSKVGTYYYVVKEDVPADKKGVTYSGAEYYVTVEVAYDAVTAGPYIESTTLVKPGSGNVAAAEFVNTYTTKPTSITIEGTKELEGKNLGNGEFTFGLYEVVDGEEELVTSTTNAATGKFAFEEIQYTTEGTHTYVVRETVPADKKGVTYDDSCFTVTVKVTDDGEGNLAAATEIAETDGADAEGVDEAIIFRNSYKAAPETISLNAVKLLENRDLKDEEFTFKVYETGADFVVAEGAEAAVTGTNDAQGNITFGSLVFDKTGTFYYVIKEDSSNPENNVVYDSKEYQITIVVYDQGGQLSSRVTYESNGSEVEKEDIVFSNVYFEPTPAEFPLEVTKDLTGRDLLAGDFTFEVYETNEDFVVAEGAEAAVTGTNDADGKVTFDPAITYEAADLGDAAEKEFYYVVKEDIPADKEGVTYDDSYFEVTIKVSDDGTGELKAEVIDITEVDGADEDVEDESVIFRNSYTAAEAELTLGGTKTLEGKDLEAEEFEFALYETGEDYMVADDAEPIDTDKNADDKTYAFGTLKFSGTETHYYVVKEIAGSDTKVDYDDTVYNIKVVATDDGKGAVTLDVYYGNIVLTQAESITIRNLDFNNGYDPDDAVLNLKGKKTLEGRELVEKEFEFALYKADQNYNSIGDALQVKKNIADATYTFDSLVFDKEGTFYYVVEEVVPEDKKDVTYDSTKYEIKVVVENDRKGALNIDVTCGSHKFKNEAVVNIGDIDFTNIYKPELPEEEPKTITVILNITKILDNKTNQQLGLDGYEFKLTSGLFDTLVNTKKTNSDGKASFKLTYTADDIGKTFSYKISEVNTQISGMVYDKRDVKVSVSISERDGALVATLKQNGREVGSVNAEFTNTFYGDQNIPVSVIISETVATGDLSNPILWGAFIVIAAAGAAGTTIYKRKKQ